MSNYLQHGHHPNLHDSLPNQSIYHGQLTHSLKEIGSSNFIAAFQSKEAMLNRELDDLKMKSIIFGSHAPVQLARERIMISQSRRLPPLSSSLLSLDIVMDKDDTFEIEDYLNVVEPEPRFPNLNEHHLMEMRLGYDTYTTF